MKSELVNHFTWITNQLSQLNQYDWSDDMKKKELDKAFKTFNNSFKKHIDFDNLTVDEARELRFQKFDDESDLWLIPLYLLPILPEGLKVKSISGEELIVGKDKLDDDTRFGALAFGLELKENKENE